MDGARAGRLADRVRVLHGLRMRLAGYRREALARDDQRALASAEELMVRVEALRGDLELRRLGWAPPGRNGPDTATGTRPTCRHTAPPDS